MNVQLQKKTKLRFHAIVLKKIEIHTMQTVESS